MFCSNCGIRVSEYDNFCSNCGRPIIKPNHNNLLLAHYRSKINFLYTKIESRQPEYLIGFNDKGAVLLNIDGSTALPGMYEDIIPCVEERTNTIYFKVKRSGKWALRTLYQYLTPHIYDGIGWTNDIPGYCYTSKNEKFGIIKISTGEEVFDCIFDNYVSSYLTYHGKLVRAISIEGKYGIIDIENKVKCTSFIYKSPAEAFESQKLGLRGIFYRDFQKERNDEEIRSLQRKQILEGLTMDEAKRLLELLYPDGIK